AARFYFVDRRALPNGRTELVPIKTVTIVPRQTREQHYAYPGLPLRINAPVVGSENFSIKNRSPSVTPNKAITNHWVQTLRPDPAVMEAGLNRLNKNLAALVQLATERGSFLRALGEADRPVRGDLGDTLSVLLLGVYQINGTIVIDKSLYNSG